MNNGELERRRRHYCFGFTLNNHTEEEVTQLLTIYSDLCKDFAVQEEIGKKNGTPHLQGYICFQNNKTLMAVIKLLPRRCSKVQWLKKPLAMKTYCLKSDTHYGRRWTPSGVNKLTRGQPSYEEVFPDRRNYALWATRSWHPFPKWYYREFGSL